MVAAIALVTVLAGAAVFQIALALGAPLGQCAWGGQHRGVLPVRFRVGSGIAVLIYAAIAVLALDRADVIDVFASSFSVVGMWVVVGWLAVSIVQNAISRSACERYLWTPLSAVMAILALLVALG